ncbi:TonB-dependent receptor plug domain-containing protein [Paraglaciecola sp. L1A13]|uniref:TonB-dependent receptor plug domain-containing protein n=1 Tax=Paraglaciecola sp. L1A13 TaxID=2686359 RepID=UPI00351A1D3A
MTRIRSQFNTYTSLCLPFSNGIDTDYVNTNNIPLAAIKHVDILKNGASATYGSDAIAGVINIITKDDFNGI